MATPLYPTDSGGAAPGKQPDTLADYGFTPTGWADYWKDELQRSDKVLTEFHKRGDRVVERYLDDRSSSTTGRKRFNILWSNTNVLLPAVFPDDPKPIAGRRYLDNDPVARVAALILERTLSYLASSTDEFITSSRAALLDRLLPGVGVTWVRYSDGGAPNMANEGDASLPITNQPAPPRTDERAIIDFVQWKDFRWGGARTWFEVPWVARRVYMNRKALVSRFGKKIGEKVPLAASPVDANATSADRDPDGKQSAAVQGVFAQAEVWEIWDKRTKSVTWLCRSYDVPLDTKPDPLKFPDFWPCPKPLFATLASNDLVPKADFLFYQDQAIELDVVTQRIAMLTKALKVVGVYDASQDAVRRMLRDGFENDLIAVDTWAAFAEKGGLKGVMDFMPIKEIAEVLMQLYQTKAMLKQDIYEITGLADVIRGASVPDETATAQRIKSQFANIRLTDMQLDISRFITEQYRMMAHIVCTLFRDETIIEYSNIEQTPDGKALLEAAQRAVAPPPQQQPAGPPGPPPMAGPQQGGNVIPMPGMTPPQMQPPPGMGAPPMQPGLQPPAAPPAPPPPTNDDIIRQAIALMRNSRLAEFRISIEESTMSEPDIVQEREQRTEYLTALTQFLQAALPAAQQTPQLAPMFASIMMWTLRSFRVGKDIEGQLESALSTLQSSAAAGGQQKPDPEMVKAQAAVQKVEAEVKGMEQKNQLALQKAQQEMQQDQQRFLQEMRQDQERNQQELMQMMTRAMAQREAGSIQIQTMQEKAEAQRQATIQGNPPEPAAAAGD